MYDQRVVALYEADYKYTVVVIFDYICAVRYTENCFSSSFIIFLTWTPLGSYDYKYELF